MQLDGFLADAPEAPTERVTFDIVWSSGGRQTKREVSAVLAFVDAFETQQASFDARAHLADKPHATPEEFQDERIYRILLRALRDADDPRRPFTSEIAKLRKAIVPSVAGSLWAAYVAFIGREFPAVVTDEQLRALEEQAEKHP